MNNLNIFFISFISCFYVISSLGELHLKFGELTVVKSGEELESDFLSKILDPTEPIPIVTNYKKSMELFVCLWSDKSRNNWFIFDARFFLRQYFQRCGGQRSCSFINICYHNYNTTFSSSQAISDFPVCVCVDVSLCLCLCLCVSLCDSLGVSMCVSLCVCVCVFMSVCWCLFI